jgi:hypothetical protein
LISFLADLVESQVDGDELFLRRVIASALFSRYKPRNVGSEEEEVPAQGDAADVGYDSEDETRVRPAQFPDLTDMSRADWVFVLFSRMWRGARTDMIKVLVKVLTTDVQCKLGIGG